jgi:hypothetical protein
MDKSADKSPDAGRSGISYYIGGIGVPSTDVNRIQEKLETNQPAVGDQNPD